MYPSTVTGSKAFGSHVVRAMVCTPAPGMLNAIVSAPGLDSESRIAWRSEPAPASLVFVTVKVAAARDAEKQKNAQGDAERMDEFLRFKAGGEL